MSSIVFLLVLGGCGLFGEDPPDEARLLMEGADGAEVEMVVSRFFFSQEQPVFDDNGFVVGDSLIVLLIEADTLTVALPFDQVFDISSRNQIYARVRGTSDAAHGMEARLWIEGNLRAQDRLTATQDSLVFIYTFRNRPQEPPPQV